MATNRFVNVTDTVLKYETYFCHFSPMCFNTKTIIHRRLSGYTVLLNTL